MTSNERERELYKLSGLLKAASTLFARKLRSEDITKAVAQQLSDDIAEVLNRLYLLC